MAYGTNWLLIAEFVALGCAAPSATSVLPVSRRVTAPPSLTEGGGRATAPKASAPDTLAAARPSATKLQSSTWALDVPDFLPSVVRLPASSNKVPVLIVTHGAGGTPEAHCEFWTRIAGERVVLLCVRGRARTQAREDGDYYPDHHALERETFAALSALRARFPEHIAAGSVYYAGFSQGATMGSLMLVEHASEVTRLALVEGGYAEWNLTRALDFRARGGERVLFVCGRRECADRARLAVGYFRTAGVPAELVYVAGAGHSHDARVEARIAALYPWFTAGDGRFLETESE